MVADDLGVRGADAPCPHEADLHLPSTAVAEVSCASPASLEQ
jgi:hypothetical protein